METITREFVYLWYYVSVQAEQIFWYWVLGMAAGSAVSVFAKDRLRRVMALVPGGFLGLSAASLLGMASPLCMYGTIPLAASFAKNGMRHEILAAFMMGSVLLNPQLAVYSLALEPDLFWTRVLSCFLCGVVAGLLVKRFGGERFFDFQDFEEPASHDTDPNVFWRYVKNLGRNLRATGPYFFLGILLSALFARYVPTEAVAFLFGGNETMGVFLAASIGVPLYVCGGGTIPLLVEWLAGGMPPGSAASFMLTGPATKITNLSALKIVLGREHFLAYILYTLGFSLMTGVLVNLILR